MKKKIKIRNPKTPWRLNNQNYLFPKRPKGVKDYNMIRYIEKGEGL
jgi:hypothetical protein